MAETKWLEPKCGFSVDGPVVRTDGSFHGKISGTAMAGVLGKSVFQTPFTTACALLGAGREDISSKPAVIAGQLLETVVIDYAQTRHPEMRFIPAKNLFEERQGDHDTWPSDFDDDVFSGHVDGMVIEADGSIAVLEVKTSGNLEAWIEGVPEYYFWQVALYSHFMAPGQDHAWVLLGIMDDESRRNPSLWKPSDDNVVLFRMDIDERRVELGMEQARAWYKEYILNNVTPAYDGLNRKDAAMYFHLAGIASDSEAISGMLEQMVALDREIADKKAPLADLEDRREALKVQVKEWMDSHGIQELASESGDFVGRLKIDTRETVNADKLRLAGIDPEPYIDRKVVKTFTIKSAKKE